MTDESNSQRKDAIITVPKVTSKAQVYDLGRQQNKPTRREALRFLNDIANRN